MRRTVGPLQINRQSQQPSVTISFNLAPDMSLGQAIEAIHTVERKVNLPVSIITGFAGNAHCSSRRSPAKGALLMARADDLHPARRALRELHPSDHDPLGCVGRHRRAAGAELVHWTCR